MQERVKFEVRDADDPGQMPVSVGVATSYKDATRAARYLARGRRHVIVQYADAAGQVFAAEESNNPSCKRSWHPLNATVNA